MRIIIINGDRQRSIAVSAILESPSTRTSLHLFKSTAKPAVMPAELAVDSRGLLQGRAEVLIRHGGETYRLRHTRNDKLILTK